MEIQQVTARYAHRTVSTRTLGGYTVDAWLVLNGMPPLGTAGMTVKCWDGNGVPVLSPQHAAAQRRVAAEMAAEDASETMLASREVIRRNYYGGAL